MNAIPRPREMDLAPLVQLMGVRTEAALFVTAQGQGREADDVVHAALLSLAVSAASLRSAFNIPIETWADCNRIALDPDSLTNTLPQLPAARDLALRLTPPKRLAPPAPQK